jgi:hypothetical protein
LATNYIYLTGTAKWVKPNKPDQYGKFTLDLYLNEPSQRVFEKSGLRLTPKKDNDGETYIKFSREEKKTIKDELVNFGPPKILNPDGSNLEGIVGNGSTLTIKVAVYNTQKGLGHRWEAARVDTLIPYERATEGSAPENGLPF